MTRRRLLDWDLLVYGLLWSLMTAGVILVVALLAVIGTALVRDELEGWRTPSPTFPPSTTVVEVSLPKGLTDAD